MDVKPKANLKRHVANFLGAVGYLLSFLQWLIVTMAYFGFIKSVTNSVIPEAEKQTVIPVVAVEQGVNLPMIFMAVIITVFMVALSIYIFVKMPSMIAKTSRKVVHEAAEHVAPVVLQVQHKAPTKKNRTKLTTHIIVILKIILVVVPVILVYASGATEDKIIDYSIVIYASLWLGALSAVFFALQYFFASVMSVKRNDLW